MEQKEQWSSKIGFILASAGSAIGLGAIWKLPYVTGTSGGGAFILIFVLFFPANWLPLTASRIYYRAQHTKGSNQRI